VDFIGLASVTSGAAPQAVKFWKQKKNVGLFASCPLFRQTQFHHPSFTRRTEMAVITWPKTTGTVSAGGGFGSSPPFLYVPTWANPLNQVIQATVPVGGNKFGGAVAMAGTANRILGFNNLPLSVWVGELPIALRAGGATAGGGPLTVMSLDTLFLQTVTPMPLGCVGFQTCITSGVTPGFDDPGPPVATVPVLVFGANFPWTTGTVRVFNSVGAFTTTRTRTGFDNRTANGTHGTLQLVTPNVLLITSALRTIGFASTAELTLEFLPEPAATTLLGSGVLLLLGLNSLRRRKR
jgi:hypothetical protein